MIRAYLKTYRALITFFLFLLVFQAFVLWLFGLDKEVLFLLISLDVTSIHKTALIVVTSTVRAVFYFSLVDKYFKK